MTEMKNVTNIESLSYEKLVELLTHEDKWLRVDAVIELEGRGERRAVAPLLELLAREDKLTQPRIIEALGNLKGKEAVEPLLKLLAQEQQGEILLEIPLALAKIGDQRAIEPLKLCLASPLPQLAAEAIKALFFLRAKGLGPQLQAMLEPLEAEHEAQGEQMDAGRNSLRLVIQRALPQFTKLG